MSDAARRLRRTLVRAAGSTDGFRWVLVHKAVEMEEQFIHMKRELGLFSWGEPPPVRTKLVSVPRSLRRVLGRHVRVLA